MTTDELNKEIDKLRHEIRTLSTQEQSYKILLNSLYGAFGAKFFRVNDVEIAECITTTGQMLTAQTFSTLDGELRSHDPRNKVIVKDEDGNDQLVIVDNVTDYIVFSDTDSAGCDLSNLDFLNTDDLLTNEETNSKLVDYVDNVLGQLLENTFDDVYNITNAYKKRITFKREKVGKIITVSKKNYTGLITNDEGLDLFHNQKHIVTGLDTVKSTMPQLFKDKINSIYASLLHDDIDNVYKIIDDTERHIYDMFNMRNINNTDDIVLLNELLDSVAKRTSVNNLEKYSNLVDTTGITIPYHVKGCMLYNELISEHQDRYTMINGGDKVCIIPLIRKGNIYNANHIAFISGEFPLDLFDMSMIDVSMIINTQFKEPVKRILDVMLYEYNKAKEIIKELSFL